MDRPVRYHPSFPSDVRDGADWYNERSPGLGAAFVDKVSEATHRVLQNPEHYAESTFGLRCARVKRFPYIVLYDLRPDELLILGVLHTAMSEDNWLERKGGAGT